MVRLDPVFRALADPTRRWIVEQLLDAAAPVSWLAEPHPMSLTALLRHIHVLEECGLVRTHKWGRVRDCAIEPEPLRAAERWLRRALWARYSERLGSLPEDWVIWAAAKSPSRNPPQAPVTGACPVSNCSTSSSSESMGAEQVDPRQR
ncbi:MAG: winged helix-turn-helix transcriptional regulator [Gammaproteobacteria bacterium]|nr:winged helix-turn-helix transcriptional regulator [Gammaproteobacteria bacterium]